MSHDFETILCVDDQREILDLVERQLAGSFNCKFASGGAEALQTVERNGPFAVILADYSMPNMDGITLLAEARRRAPEMVPVMLTAFGDIDVAINALHHGNIFRFLRKPWQPEDLHRALTDAVDQHRLITAERRLREELAETNRRLDEKVQELDDTNRLLEYWVELSPAVLYNLENDGREFKLTYVSKNFARLTGHERTAMLVDPGFWLNNLHDEDRAQAIAGRAALQNGRCRELTLEYRVRHRDTGYVQILDSMRAICAPTGETLEIVGAWVAAGGGQKTISPI